MLSRPFLYEVYSLNRTQQIHIILTHYKFYFEKMGVNFKDKNGVFGKTLHSTLKKFEAKKEWNIIGKIGGNHAVIIRYQRICTMNALKMGSFRAQEMTLRSPASTPRSPACCPGWNHAKKFKMLYLDNVKVIHT